MIRKKFRINSWKLGREFMSRISSVLKLPLEEMDENIRITSDKIMINCFLDDREFSFITVKIYEDTLLDKLQKIINEFT